MRQSHERPDPRQSIRISVLAVLKGGTADMELLLIPRNLERVADLATNIAEDTVYLVEGTTTKHNIRGRLANTPKTRDIPATPKNCQSVPFWQYFQVCRLHCEVVTNTDI
jgi:hypothetical protein